MPLRVLWRQICVLIFFMITLVSYSGGGLVGKCHLCAEVYPIYHHLVEDNITRMLVLLYFCLVRYIVCQAFLCVGLVCLWSRRFCYRVFFLHFNDRWYIYRVGIFDKHSLLIYFNYITAQNTNVKSWSQNKSRLDFQLISLSTFLSNCIYKICVNSEKNMSKIMYTYIIIHT